VRLHPVARSADSRLSITLGYDAIAAHYDQQVRGDQWMRRALHDEFALAFRPGQRVLDVGCGTGLDALALARRGIRVLGIDGSAQMLAQLQARLAAEPAGKLIETRVLRIEDLSELHEEAFDGLLSSFASLSSVADLTDFATQAARLVRPGGHLVLHLLNRFSVWEWLGYVRHADWPSAVLVGRLRKRNFTIGGQTVEHRLYFPEEAYRRYFAADFRLHRVFGLGAIRPPHTVRRLPQAAGGMLEALDVASGRLPLLRRAGRFFVLHLERRTT
jgi:SAM-dependent methyltransferase